MAHKKRRAPRASKAAKDLENFLKSRRISLRVVSEALGVSHPAIIGWLNGVSKPDATHRKAIAIWTKGEIPECAWLEKKERDLLSGMRAYEPPTDPGRAA